MGYSRKRVRIAIPEIGQDMHNYTAAVRGVGAEPVIISTLQEQSKSSAQQEYLDAAEFRPENYDGLLLPGGVDIEPWRYGQENHGSINMDPALDALQLEILDQSIRVGLPVFGICRGHQLINVYFGGDMIQHIVTADAHARYCLEEPDKVHESLAEAGSWIAGIYGRKFYHNSAHHQAVDRVGDGLIVDMFSTFEEDGVVEAMHHRELPVYSVQWHPERMCFENARTDTVDGSLVLEWFVELCAARHFSAETAARSENHHWASGI